MTKNCLIKLKYDAGEYDVFFKATKREYDFEIHSFKVQEYGINVEPSKFIEIVNFINENYDLQRIAGK